jgi:aminomethyltransferase
MPANPLYALHQQAEAEFQAYDTLEIVCTFGEPQAEYAALRKGCALLDWPQRGILEVTGKDRLPFLNNLLTNQTWNKETKTGLSPGQGVYAFFLNTKGRIEADMNVLERGDRTWLEMDARLIEPTRLAFEKFLFAEQVKLTAREDLHEISLQGPGAPELLAAVLGAPCPDLPPLGSFKTQLLDVEILLWRDDAGGAPGFYLIAPSEAASTLWSTLLARFGAPTDTGKRLLRPAGWAAWNATRIEAGRPLFGIDFDNSILPAETAQLARAVSFTKGCYLGQEIVARMHARGQVARQLVGLKMQGDALPLAGTKIYDDQENEVGGVTSSTLSPVLSNTAICLGLVKRNFIAPGARVHIPAEGALHPATVTALPFFA